jgi:hypothetical protein
MRGASIFVLMAALLAGCASPGTLTIDDLHGVRCVVEGRSMGMDERDGETRLYNERATIRLRDGRLHRNDAYLGEVRPGDRVLLARNGRVYVNDAERGAN